MSAHRKNRTSPAESRREFLKKTGTAALAVAGANLLPLTVAAAERSASISIVLDQTDSLVKQPCVQWAAEQLRDTLALRGLRGQIYDDISHAPRSQQCVFAASRQSTAVRSVFEAARVVLPGAPESLALAHGKVSNRSVLVAAGSDARGLAYALLELADRVEYAEDPLTALRVAKPVFEQPANEIRSVSRAFVSDVEDKPWFNDRAFWSRYLTTLAANRFNRFNLGFGIGYDFTTGITDCYFHFAYPFLLAVPGYEVRAVPLSDAERDSNLELLRFISEETVRRGMHFQLGLWTHAYRWTNSPKANYTIQGLTPETQAPYCRDALRTLLTACPAISGITFRIHGESGVPEGNYDLWKTIFDGVAQCGRRVEIDMHAKGMDQGMIDVALGTGQPVNISPKFWAEHMGLPYMQGAIRPLEMPPRNARTSGFFSRSSGSRSFLRYGYGDLLAEDRRYGVLHRMWPGTQRLLLWGDPETAADYGRVSSFCGSKGMELMEPLFFKGRKGSGLPGGRDAYADTTLRPPFDFEKYLYTYRVWGRGLYNPDGDPNGPRRLLNAQFGRAAENVEGALASAGKILPLVTTAHCPSAANNNYWPEMYYNMAIVDPNRRNPYGDTPSPKRFGTVSPLDPEFFLSCDQFADELLKGERSGRYSPVWVAQQLNRWALDARSLSRKAKSRVHDSRKADFRRFETDSGIQAGLGDFFAAKFRSGVLYALHLRTKSRSALEEALKANRSARSAWAQLASDAKGVYRDDVTFGPEYFQRGHWSDRLEAIDQDIADMEELLKQPPASDEAQAGADDKLIEHSIRLVIGKPEIEEHPIPDFHNPPASFRRGEPLAILGRVPPVSNLVGTILGIRLRYRRVNQAETWQMVEMEESNREYRAAIPGDYTDSAFPLQYHFQIRASSGAWLYPGLSHRWGGQPYFVVR